jgi:hypothetical protein
MGTLYNQFLDNPLASVFGIVGLVCLAIWPVFHSRATIMAAQLAIGIAYALHYALLEAWTGAAVTLVGALQALSTLHLSAERRLRFIAFAFLPIPGFIAAATWVGVPSLLAATALTLIMIGRMQSDEYRMRLVLLAAAPIGMAHDLMIGSLPAFAGGAIAMLIGAVILWRLTDTRHPPITVDPRPMAPGPRRYPKHSQPAVGMV